MKPSTPNLKLRERRKALGLTQHQAADLLGVSRATWEKWEHGQAEPHPANAQLLHAFMAKGERGVKKLRGVA